MDKLAACLSIDWVERREERRKEEEEEDRWRQRSQQQQQKTHMPRLVSRSLTPSRTKTKIRHHPSMCCFAWSCRFVPSLLLPGQANLRCSSSSVSTRTCFLLLYLYPSNCLFLCCSPHRSLYLDFSLHLCNISWLCLCFCPLEWEFVLFVHLHWRIQGGGAIGQLPSVWKFIAQWFFEMIQMAQCWEICLTSTDRNLVARSSRKLSYLFFFSSNFPIKN